MSWFEEALERLSETDRLAYERSCDDFEEVWRSNPQTPPRLADFLPASDPLRTLVAVALAKTALEMRWKKQERCRSEQYFDILPSIDTHPEPWAELVAWEFEFARRFGESAGEFLRR